MGRPISGKLLSGTLPVAKAHVYLMAVAETGYGKPSVSLLDARSTGSQDSVGAYVVTAEDGSFTIPGYYRCGADDQSLCLHPWRRLGHGTEQRGD